MSTRSEAIRAKLRNIIHELSGYPEDELGETSTFMELGFDSLFLTQLSTAFQNEFQVRITFRQLFSDLATIAALAAHLDREMPADATPATPATPAPAPEAATMPAVAPVPAAASAAPSAQLAPVTAPPPAAVVAPAANGAANGAASGGRIAALQAVMAQQLDLMNRQLAMLQDARAGALPADVAPAAAQPAATQPAAVAPSPPPQATTPTASPAAGAPTGATPEPSTPSGFDAGARRREGSQLTLRQRRQLDDLIARYTRRTAGSKERTQQYRRWHADPRTASGFNPLWKEMVYPLWVERASGARLWDVDGNEYIDILNGFGPNFFGHSPPFITQALKAQLERGIEVGPQTPLAGETAQLFCELTGMDRVSFVNTGSEAVQAAMRLARTVTGRDKVAIFRKDYHGNFDEVLVRGVTVDGEPRTRPLAPGIPQRAVQDVVVLEYGSPEALEWIRRHASGLAAVLVEPVQSRAPELQPREFLQEIRRITRDADTLLIFDEVITGLRMGPGGAQAFYGVDADLATYGKVLGGGMPIGAVAGRADVMDTFDGGQWQYGDDSFPEAGVTFFAGTFVRHPLAIAAAHASLTYLKAAGPSLQEGVNRRTTRLAGALNQLFREKGVNIEVPHCCSQLFIRVNESSELATLLFYHLRDRGVHVLEGFPSYMTAAHTDEDVDTLIECFRSSIEEMQAGDLLPATDLTASQPAASAPDDAFALTSAQRDVWLAAQLGDLASCAFNESDTLELRGRLDDDLLRRAVQQVLRRHQAFSLVFDEDGSRQRMRSWTDIPMPVQDLSALADREREAGVAALLRDAALEPFPLETGPLVRTFLIRLSPDHHLFVLYCHHMVFDGWSADVVMREIAAVYTGLHDGDAPELAPARPYAEYAAAQARAGTGPVDGHDHDWWLSVLADPPRLELPTDRARPAARSYNADTFHATLDADVCAGARSAARRLGVTSHALLLGAFEVLLSRLSGQSDLIVGVPAAGQAMAGPGPLVGYAVNLLPVRVHCERGVPFSDFVRTTHNGVLDAFEHQRADFSRIVDELNVERDPARLPLVEVVFNYSGFMRTLEFAGLDATARENRRYALLHDLFMNIVETADRFVIDWDFNTDLFDRETIAQWVRHYEVLLDAIAHAPDTPVDELPLLSDEEKRNLWSGAGTGAVMVAR